MAKSSKRKSVKPAKSSFDKPTLKWRREVDRYTKWVIYEAYTPEFTFTILFAGDDNASHVEHSCYYNIENDEAAMLYFRETLETKTVKELESDIERHKHELLFRVRCKLKEMTRTVKALGGGK